MQLQQIEQIYLITIFLAFSLSLTPRSISAHAQAFLLFHEFGLLMGKKSENSVGKTRELAETLNRHYIQTYLNHYFFFVFE